MLTFGLISRDVISYLVRWLKINDLLSFCKTCKYCLKILIDENFWKNKILFEFPDANLTNLSPPQYKAKYFLLSANLLYQMVDRYEKKRDRKIEENEKWQKENDELFLRIPDPERRRIIVDSRESTQREIKEIKRKYNSRIKGPLETADNYRKYGLDKISIQRRHREFSIENFLSESLFDVYSYGYLGDWMSNLMSNFQRIGISNISPFEEGDLISIFTPQ